MMILYNIQYVYISNDANAMIIIIIIIIIIIMVLMIITMTLKQSMVGIEPWEEGGRALSPKD